MRILSLGAGVQSSTMALMFKHEHLSPMPDAAIFSDTQAEPAAVYAWLEELKVLLPFPVHVVTGGSLTDALMGAGYERRFVGIPSFTHDDKGDGQGRRQCTQEFKLRPIQRKVQELCGFEEGRPLPPGAMPAQVLIGISTDEHWRYKPSRVSYIVNIHPLLAAKISRNDCIAWMQRHGYPIPPKSSCSGGGQG